MPRANALLIGLISLCLSLSAGCSVRTVYVPEVIGITACGEPETPAIAQVDPGRMFDEPVNVTAFDARDVVIRDYISALKRTIGCYRAQTVGEK